LSHSTRPRARRYPLRAAVELIDLQSGMELKQSVNNLSLHGCHVGTNHLWSVGTRVRLRMSHQGATFAALAKVTYARPVLGMGLEFTHIDPNNQSVLDKWIAELSEQAN
jgi:hypothetical protein